MKEFSENRSQNSTETRGFLNSSNNSVAADSFEAIIEPENFKKLTDIETLFIKDLLPQQRKALFDRLLQPEHFNRLIARISDVLAVHRFFPEYSSDFLQILLKPQNLKPIFSGVAAASTLAKIFPQNKRDFFAFLLANFKVLMVKNHGVQRQKLPITMVQNISKAFPEYKEDLFVFISNPANFSFVVQKEADLEVLRAIFPEKDIFKTSLKSLAIQLKKDSLAEKAYTCGALMGMLATTNIPKEILYKIGTYANRDSGAHFVLVNKAAYHQALESRRIEAEKQEEEEKEQQFLYRF